MRTSFYTPVSLRNAVVSKLKAFGITHVGDNVFKSRTENGWPEEGVFICVYTNSSDFDDEDRSPTFYKVNTSLVIDVVVVSKVFDSEGDVYDLNDLLDMVTAEVVAALTGYPREEFFANGVKTESITLRSVQNTLNGDGETDKGAQKLTFNVVWNVEVPVNDSTAGNDYVTAHTDLVTNGKTMSFETDVKGEV